MTFCFPFIRKKQKNNKEIYLIILGLDNAGKTTATRSIKGISSDLVVPTIGFDRIEFSIDKYNINLYDLGGGKNIRDIWQTYFAEVHGVIFVVDSVASERLKECRMVLAKLLAHPSIAGKPVLLLANKRDSADALDESELIDTLQLDDLVNQHRCPCRLERCCALLHPGKKLDRAIRNGLRWLLAYIESDLTNLEARIRADVSKQAREQALEREARRERVRLAKERRERMAEQAADAVHSNGDVALSEEIPALPEEVCVVTGDMKNSFAPSTMIKVKKTDLDKRISRTVGTLQEDNVKRSRSSLPVCPTPSAESVDHNERAPRMSTRSMNTNPNLTMLLKSSELRRQIAIACSLELEPVINSANTDITESIQIEELDEPDFGGTLQKETVFQTVPSMNGSVTQQNDLFQSTDPSCLTENTEHSFPAPNDLPIQFLNNTKMDDKHTGQIPCMVDPLYGRGHKESPFKSAMNETGLEEIDVYSTYLSVASSTKRPSPLTRLFSPSINKLYPLPGNRNKRD
ncbi:ADP-ribosylation factor protein 13B [Paragonimus heterotremus]|uniref:ADP-ribosylation factor protein 13B n=1 Tax=Paragonimus heterotremus TaxID=100268 RepID=A0A8J4WEG3_9TREM|nr:ADP-ribosylation factor protein 13B [Paragonimus heterotremus]